MLLASSSAVYAASYEVQEIPLSDTVNQHFAVSIDNQGMTLSTGRVRYNPPIDLSLFDPDNHFGLSDPDAAAEGNFNVNDLSIVYQDLTAASTSGDVRLQKLSNVLAYSSDGTEVSYVNGFDTETEATNGYTYSLLTAATDNVNGTHIVGNMAGPYSVVNYVDENDAEQVYVVNNFAQRGFVQVGENVVELVPEFARAGGFSFAAAINDNLQVAGISSVGASDPITELLDNCEDAEIRPDLPLEVCNYLLYNTNNFAQAFLTNTGFLVGNNRNTELESIPTSHLDMRPTLWQLDANGNILSTQIFDLLHTPEEFSLNMYTRVTDINNDGVMVGFTTTDDTPREGGLIAVATAFENGAAERLFESDQIKASYAMGINDNDYVVGFYPQIVNDIIRNRMFVFNRQTDELRLPDGFFVTSTTYPRAINNNNLVVGDAESDVLDPSTRKVSGFLYDIDNDTFTNLNDLLPCDSPYFIISANDINDENQIIADAQINRPRKDITGELISDETDTGDVVVSVILNPTGAAPSDCSSEDDDTIERQGASNSLFIALGLLVISVFRRKIKS